MPDNLVYPACYSAFGIIQASKNKTSLNLNFDSCVHKTIRQEKPAAGVFDDPMLSSKIFLSHAQRELLLGRDARHQQRHISHHLRCCPNLLHTVSKPKQM